ncbi:hypothetical protein [Bradyrhizobium sp. BWA-3-5]|uniref:hypothetical protein n=1 Tax=Bradyrhizobium sp. BWA-3-5 TaxID=3080013 RepID=UPI0039786DBE
MLLEKSNLARGAKGQAVLLSGDAGIGKSRLVQVLIEKLDTAPHEVICLQCSPYHSNSALFPIVQNLSRMAAFRPGRS